MADDGRTEKASPYKIKQERERGNIAKSGDLTSFLTLVSLAVVLFVYGETMVKSMTNSVAMFLDLIAEGIEPWDLLIVIVIEIAKVFMPIVIIVTFFQVLNYVIQVRFLFSLKIIKPDLNNISPMKYIKNLFNKRTIVENIKSTMMVLLIGYVSYTLVKGDIGTLMETLWMPWQDATASIFSTFKMIFYSLLGVLFIIATFDFAYQKWDYSKRIRMTKEEVRLERKNYEMNPEIKQRQRQLMWAFMQNDVTNKVPEATFIVNNPTHISVAVKYKVGEDDVPTVVAKGEEELALYIRRIAKEHDIPMVENKPLARALYYNVEPGNQIDEEMWEAVAEVIKYLIQTNQLEMN